MPVVGSHMLLYTPEAEASGRVVGDDDFGVWVTMLLPGGVELLLYEPTHATPLQV
jgi:hypothetical protein